MRVNDSARADAQLSLLEAIVVVPVDIPIGSQIREPVITTQKGKISYGTCSPGLNQAARMSRELPLRRQTSVLKSGALRAELDPTNMLANLSCHFQVS
jgi:hypothetical protein